MVDSVHEAIWELALQLGVDARYADEVSIHATREGVRVEVSRPLNRSGRPEFPHVSQEQRNNGARWGLVLEEQS